MSSPGAAKGPVPIEILQLAERGAKLFPLAPHSKVPLVPNWQAENNTSDPLDLEYILQQVPDCNWGMCCGPRSGRFVLDYDVKDGRPGLDWYQHQLEIHGPDLADTLRVRTPTGGMHEHFRWPDFQIGNDNTGKLAKGVDIKGLGGYVVVPPSEVGGKRYYFEDCDGEKEVLPAPGWLLDDLRPIFAIGHEGAREGTKEPQKVPIGRRHDTLLRQGKMLARAGASWQAILREFEILNQEFEQLVSHDELEYQARDIYQRYRSRVYLGNGHQAVETSRLILQPFSEIQVEPISWLWPPYLPRGTMTLLTGEPGVGKSYIALWIAAVKITQEGGRVIYFTIENSASKISVPRFQSLGGDLTRMYQVKGIQFGDSKDEKLRRVMLEDIAIIEREVRRLEAVLIIIDPLQSYLGTKVNSDRATETRPILDGLLELAENLDTTVLVNRHGRKGGVGRILEKGLGTIDFTAAARSELYVGKSSDGQLAMMHIKANLGPFGPTMGYEITGMSKDGVVSQGGFFSWTGELNLSPQDLMAPDASREDESAGIEAETFLYEFLQDGAKLSREVQKGAREAGIAEITLRRARGRIGVKFRKRIGDGRWEWFIDGPSAYT